MNGDPILIAGPTASGKSALATALARRLGGVVVNADSQPVYGEWRVLTARPSALDEAAAPHRLYGHVGVTEAYSVGRWLDEVRGALAAASLPETPPRGSQGRGFAPDSPRAPPSPARGGVWGEVRGVHGQRSLRPIIVGGTGLYFRALTRGLAPVPEIPAEVRAAGEAALAREGLARVAADLARRDPETAAALDLANPRRVLRAWEVLETTGEGLGEWQARAAPPLVPLDRALAIALKPPRAGLYARCDARLDAMVAGGALDEIARVMALGVPPSAPAMKAVGAAELAAHLAGEIPLAEAVARARTATRRYAKRQLAWMRNQMPGWRIDAAAPGLTERVLALARD